MTPIATALFIDYDNVHTELTRYDPSLAARFSNRTLTWLEALEKQLPAYDPDGRRRRIVARRCYASPHLINPYRRNFTQNGFEVIDCPPLTTHLKNSADIYIVMDVIDYLGRYPHIDEYIILSGDADFVPVLNRLRKELKRSVIFASYNTTAAYRNCSDQRIEAEFFAEHLAVAAAAQRPSQAAEAAPVAADTGEYAAAIEARLIAAATNRLGLLPFATAAQALRQAFPAELGDNWGGRGTFTALLETLRFARLTVDWDAQELAIPDFTLDLPDWDEADRDTLVEFVTDVLGASAKHIPLLAPAEYRFIFGGLADYFRADAPGTFTEATNEVAAANRARGGRASAQEIRFIGTGISMQQYRFVEGAAARQLAGLWRAQVFDLCGKPDWLREADDALLLATWFRAEDETPTEGAEDFLVRTADTPSDDEAGPAA